MEDHKHPLEKEEDIALSHHVLLDPLINTIIHLGETTNLGEIDELGQALTGVSGTAVW